MTGTLKASGIVRDLVARMVLVLALLLAVAGLAQAQLVPVPALSGRVVDLTGTFSATQKSDLSAQLEALERQKGSQLVVLMVPSTQPEDIAQYSIRVAESWKIGRGKVGAPGKEQKVDDGVILLVAKNDRKLRIEVGYGLEGAIPDALAKRIITDSITPKFKTGDFFGGVQSGVNDLSKLIQGEALPAPPEVWQHGQGEPPSGQAGGAGDDPMGWVVPLIMVVVLGFVLKAMIGRFLGSAAAGGAGWLVSAAFGAPAVMAIVAGVVVFLLLLILGGSGGGMVPAGRRSYRSSGGGWGGGSGDGGGFSGGGGGFGGGGASGDW